MLKTDFSWKRFLIFMDETSDIRTKNWPTIESPNVMIVSVILYLIVIALGPRFMKNRQAFNLKSLIIVYNLSLVVLNGYMFYLFMKYAIFSPTFNPICFNIDYSYSQESNMLALAVYLFYFSKLIELFDTLFFVLRKKNNQISFLHVYHHATMPFLWWLGAKFVPNGESYLSPCINSLVHVFMYAYYGLSAMGPWIQKYLWWKRYITVLQMWQFGVVIVKTLITLFSGCNFPNSYLCGQLVYMLSLLVLFINFYSHTYNKIDVKHIKTA